MAYCYKFLCEDKCSVRPVIIFKMKLTFLEQPVEGVWVAAAAADPEPGLRWIQPVDWIRFRAPG